MRTNNIKRNILLYTISMIMVIGLTGCFKGNISVDVSWSGSAVASVALGMTQQAQSLIGSQGENPFQDMQKTMADASGKIPTGVKVKQWREGDYDWMSATKKFSNLEQVNQMLENKTLFNHFSLTRNRGVFQDEFILDAEFAALGADMPENDLGLDPTTFINMSFSARLPGTIMETTGFADINDPNLLVWNAQGKQTVSIRARSLSVNWLNVFGIIAGLFMLGGFGIYAFGGFDSILYPPKKRIDYLPQDQPALQSSVQKTNYETNYIVELGIEDLLNQVNARALNSVGEIRRQPMEIALLWKDDQAQQRFIFIKDLGNHEIAINGKNFSATRDNAKTGIMNAIQKQK